MVTIIYILIYFAAIIWCIVVGGYYLDRALNFYEGDDKDDDSKGDLKEGSAW
jgi:hypothetical protein